MAIRVGISRMFHLTGNFSLNEAAIQAVRQNQEEKTAKQAVRQMASQTGHTRTSIPYTAI